MFDEQARKRSSVAIKLETKPKITKSIVFQYFPFERKKLSGLNVLCQLIRKTIDWTNQTSNS